MDETSIIDQEDLDEIEISFVDDYDEDAEEGFQQIVDQEDLEEVDISFVDDNDETLDETIEEAEWHGALIGDGDRLDVLNVVEAIILEQLNSFVTPRASPAFRFPNFHSKRNLTFIPEHGLVPITWEDDGDETIEISAVKFDVPTSQKKFVRMMHILNKIHALLVNDEVITKRELYYQLLRHDGGTMEQVDEAIQTIVVMLQIPRGQLRILATSKGLIAGNLTYTNTNGIEIDCSASTHGKKTSFTNLIHTFDT